MFTLGGRADKGADLASRLTREAARICLLGARRSAIGAIRGAAAQDPHTEIFTGFDASNNAIKRLFGRGLRLRQGDYARPVAAPRRRRLGRYDYRGTLFGGGAISAHDLRRRASYGAALLGYEFRADALIVKLFAGIEAEDQQHQCRAIRTMQCKGALSASSLRSESWLDISPLWFLSADASYGTAFQEYWSLLRLGCRFDPRFSLGLEGGALGNEEYDAGRGGGFVRA